MHGPGQCGPGARGNSHHRATDSISRG